MLRVVRAAGQVRSRASPACWSVERLFAGKPKDHHDLDDDAYELLPPGASMKDPLYGLSEDDKVFHHDNKRVASDKQKVVTHKPRLPNSEPLPHSREAAQQRLKSLKKAKEEEEDDDRYVYLPPGSSMREPGDSMSDPGERRVYHRDPPTSTPKKE